MDFEKQSFSGYTRAAVGSQLLKALNNNDLETSCHWMAEIDLSNWQDVLWEKITLYASKSVHFHNPRLPLLLKKHLTAWTQVPSTDRSGDPSLRQGWCQILGALVYSEKGAHYELPATSSSIIDVQGISIHPWVQRAATATDSMAAQTLLSKLFWEKEFHRKLPVLQYIFDVEKEKLNAGKLAIRCRIGTLPDIPPKFSTDWVWLFWETLLRATTQHSEQHAVISSLLTLFAFNFTSAKKKTRIPMMIHALLLLHQAVDFSKDIFPNASLIQKACQNIHLLYDEIVTARSTAAALKMTTPFQPKGPRVPLSGGCIDPVFMLPKPVAPRPLTALEKMAMVDQLYDGFSTKNP